MNSTETIAAALIKYLQTAPDARGPIDMETDLLTSGRLDSLQVMDLVCFLEDRFAVRMQPADINPHNMRSILRLSNYVYERLSSGKRAA